MPRGRIAILLLSSLARLAAAGEDEDAIVNSGLFLASQGRWADARQEFLRGARAYPEQTRFLIELGGIAYRMGDREDAKSYFKRVLAIDPGDSYANDALGSIYLIEGRLEAALVYWNRIGMPRLARVEVSAPPQISATLATRAMEAQPGGILRLDDLEASRADLNRIGLGGAHFDLSATSGESYDLRVAGSGGADWLTGWARLAPVLAELPYETIDYDFRVLPPVAGRVETTFRWDENKRLLRASFTGIPRGDPRWRYRFVGFGIDENWDVRVPASDTYFHLRQAGASAEIQRGFGSRLDWTNSLTLSTREFSSLSPNAPAALFQNGPAIKETSEITYRAIRPAVAPVALTLGAKAQAGRVLAAPGAFSKIEASARLQWAPRRDSLVIEAGSYIGRAFGSTPFDELFQVGMERDNSLWLRGHVGTYNGLKGNSPVGSAYTLFQWDAMQTVFRKPFVRVSLGPFVDSANVARADGRYGSNGWLLDTGLESRVRLMNAVTIAVVCGRDTRTGNTVFYTAIRK